MVSSVWYVGRCLIAGKPAWAAILNEQVRVFPADASLADCLKPRSVEEVLSATIASTLLDVHWLAPIDQQEVWAAGVTYLRSKQARMDESERAASVYDLVYNADRPEIFFKATANRVVGPKQPIRIRVDSKWNVPEPELVVALDPQGNIIGYTIGNDMSSRDIEGANPLYLPQAKVYSQCCGLGPWIIPTHLVPDPHDLEITLQIRRANETVFTGATNTSQMKRQVTDLVSWLLRENEFPNGCFLSTGTGIIPDADFTLQPKDEIAITVSTIGTLENVVVQG